MMTLLKTTKLTKEITTVLMSCLFLMTNHSCHEGTSLLTGGKPVVLWLGTSIPAGCSYPEYSCKQNGLACINNSENASFLSIRPDSLEISSTTGLSLVMTSKEKDDRYGSLVSQDIISKKQLNKWKKASLDKYVLPYLDLADVIVIDHGYNDESMEALYQLGKDNIDWETRDRTNFIGAFNYLYDIIKTHNPSAKVVVGGYFQNKCTIGHMRRGVWVCSVLTWISEHYDLPLLNVWDYVDIPDGYMPNSSHYLDSIGYMYLKFYEKYYPDKDGNITYFQKFCPDGVHPYSDPLGKSNAVLNEVFTRLLKEKVLPLIDDTTAIKE